MEKALRQDAAYMLANLYNDVVRHNILLHRQSTELQLRDVCAAAWTEMPVTSLP